MINPLSNLSGRTGTIVGIVLRVAVIAVIALIVSLATNGDDDSSSADTPTSPPVQVGGQLPSDVQECLSQKGVQPPQPGQAPDGSVDPEKLQRALEDCGATPPGGAIPFGCQAPGSG
jgi:hypothetical protein